MPLRNRVCFGGLPGPTLREGLRSGVFFLAMAWHLGTFGFQLIKIEFGFDMDGL